MNIVTFLGSPKKEGKTAEALGYVEEALSANGHDVERFNLADTAIGGCRECLACTRVEDRPGCVQNDDAQNLFERMFEADEIIYGSPLIGWDISSLLKPFMDRHFSLVKGYHTPAHRSFLGEKNLTLLITCMGPAENNADLVRTFFHRFGDYLKAGTVRKYVVPRSLGPDYPDRARETARRMTEEITG